MSHCVSWRTGLTPSPEKWVGLDEKMQQEPCSSARVQARRLAMASEGPRPPGEGVTRGQKWTGL